MPIHAGNVIQIGCTVDQDGAGLAGHSNIGTTICNWALFISSLPARKGELGRGKNNMFLIGLEIRTRTSATKRTD
jgi:hypothetical protein